MWVKQRARHWITAAAVLGGSVGDGFAQTYPTRALRMIVAFSAGSGTDTIARLIARGLSQSFGQHVIVENRAGAAGNIGAEIAARAPADGYTLFLVNMGHAANVSLYRNLGYDLRRDFAPVTQVASSPSLVVVHPSVPARTLGDFVKLAKGRPGDINYSSGGLGTATFVAVELFKIRAGINLMHVPYRSGGEAITAVISGEVSVYFAPMATALPNVRYGRLRALAVTSTERVLALRNTPTVAELGYPGYQAGNWYGLAVPAMTPHEVIAAIRGAMLNALTAPELAKSLTQLGYVLIGDDPDEFAAHIQSEIDQLARVLKDVRTQ